MDQDIIQFMRNNEKEGISMTLYTPSGELILEKLVLPDELITHST